MPTLVAVGEVLVDVLAPALAPAGAVHAPIVLRAGGSPVNAALAAAAEGAHATVIGRIGADAAGRMLRDELAAAGVDARLAVDDELPTGTFLAAGGAVAADRGASARLSPADLPDRIVADVVLVSEYAPPDVVRAVVERADARWVAGRDAVFVAGDEAELDDLAAQYRLAVVTLGERGAVASLDGVVCRQRPRELVGGRLVGAGDAFAAVLLLALAGGANLADALARAGDAAVRHAGSRARSSGR